MYLPFFRHGCNIDAHANPRKPVVWSILNTDVTFNNQMATRTTMGGIFAQI